ncbi:MAG: ankyrin repeat domain-containing protein [Azospirillaceae bacterium]
MGEQSQNPNTILAQRRKAAKRLRKALVAGDAAARARFDAVFNGRREPGGASHADCLHVVAREAGAESWPRLKLAVETAALDRAQRVAALERAITNGNFPMVDRLLALDAGLADAHLGLQLAFAREAPVLAALDRDPEAATRQIGRRWPIHHLCFSRMNLREPEAVARQFRLLDALLAAGADVNQGFAAEPGEDHTLSPLYGALGHAGNLALARRLLERGADPNDNESLYHATELDTLDGVRLLFAHGAEVGTTNAFHRMLDRESPEGVRLFFAHGADPASALYAHPTGRTQDDRTLLHHAIIRGRSAEIGAILLEHGVDPLAVLDGRTPYALARVCGNRAMADMLEARGYATPLDATDRFLACVTEGDGAGARALLDADPGIRQRLGVKDLTRQTELAMSADSLPVLRLLAELGFDPNLKGESDMPPVHAAAWWGHADIVEMYLGFGVELESLNMFGGTALGTAVHGSMNCPGREQGDYLRTVRLLVEAGAQIRPEHGDLEMGSEEVTAYLEGCLEARG